MDGLIQMQAGTFQTIKSRFIRFVTSQWSRFMFFRSLHRSSTPFGRVLREERTAPDRLDFSECPRVSGSILTRPKIVVRTSPVKKVTKKRREDATRERATYFFSTYSFFFSFNSLYMLDSISRRGIAQKPRRHTDLIHHFFPPHFVSSLNRSDSYSS